jgi:predicted phosphodiesterase
MRVGVISDTHGLLRPEAVVALRGSDLIVHAGDIGRLDVLEQLRHVLIGIVADHEREPLRGVSRRGSKEKRHGANGNKAEAHSSPTARSKCCAIHATYEGPCL